MASEIATTLSSKLTHDVPEDVLEWGRRIIDGEIQELREVLAGLGPEHHRHFHADIRELMARLSVDGGKGD